MDKELAQAFQNAPLALQHYLGGDDIDSAVISIASSFGLPIASYLPIKNACILVILGLAETSDLLGSLEDTLGVDEEKAKELSKKIDDIVFDSIREILQTKDISQVKEIKVGNTKATGDSIRANMLPNKEGVIPLQTPKSGALVGSRTMLMDQLSLIGQIPKDEDVLMRLNKIKEQLRKGEEDKIKIDTEIKAREQQEKFKHAQEEKITVPRRVYDVDPYREGVNEDELSL